MSDFEFRLGNRTYKTGLKVPETKPLGSFSPYGTGVGEDLWDIDDCTHILSNEKRKRAREAFPDSDNQGRRSSCNGLAAAGAMRKFRGFHGHPDMHFAGEYIYAHINGGRDQGSMLDDGMRFIEQHGCAPRSMVKREIFRENEIGIEAKRIAPGYRVICRSLPTDDTLENLWRAIICALCNRHPIVLAVHVGNKFMNSDEHAGIDNGSGNHAVHCDDSVMIKDSPKHWFDFRPDMDNSWDDAWADSGRTYLRPQNLEQTRRYHEMYAIVGAIESPHDADPPAAA